MPPPNLAEGLSRPEGLLNFTGNRRLPVILQTEIAECGLVCLAMVASYHGFDTDMTQLRKRFGVSSQGVQLKQLMDVAGRLNLATRALRAEPENLDQVQLPCIMHWGMNHFVVLKSIKSKKLEIHDPALGLRQIDRKELGENFTGVLLELTPTENFEPGEDRKQLKLRHFWSRVMGLKRSLVQIILLSLLLQVFVIVSPFYMQTVIDDVILQNDAGLLIVLALGFGLLLLIEIGTKALREFVILYLSSRMNIQIAANLFRHLIRLPMDYFSKRHMGDIVSRFGSLQSIREMLTRAVVTAVVDGAMAIMTLVVMFYYDAFLTLIVLGVVILYGLFRWAFYRPFRLLSEEGIMAKASENSHFMESVRAIQTIKLFQRENDRQSHWQNRLANVINKNIRLTKWGIGYDTVNRLLFGLENIVVIYFAATAVMGNLMSVGMLYAFMSYKNRFVDAMDGLIAEWIEFKMLELHLNRLSDIAFTQPEAVDEHQILPLARASEAGYQQTAGETVFSPETRISLIDGRIEARNLAYHYSQLNKPVFANINLIIEPGESVAIVGPSGCGKTTLLKCLMGLIEPTEGEVLIDGKPIKQMPHYRSQIGGVMQEDQLLSGDIADNIACFEPKIDMAKVKHCAQVAQIHDEILQMPMQYHTLVGDMGANLSGGQKQRIVLARAIYCEPRILFMDEATSHLDITNEFLVNDRIKALNVTRVLVAHRPETVNAADRKIDISPKV